MDEIQQLYGLQEGEIDFSRGLNQAIGYKPFVQHLQGLHSYEEAVALTKLHTRQYAKRQVAWFRTKFLEKAKGIEGEE